MTDIQSGTGRATMSSISCKISARTQSSKVIQELIMNVLCGLHVTTYKAYQ